jgi:hypothetical protein
MEALDRFRQSTAWHPKYDLPTTQLNNPWIYLAYAVKIVRQTTKSSVMGELDAHDQFIDFLSSCEKAPGLFNRWPDGSGGLTSHDELMGIAYLNCMAANRIIRYLHNYHGVYNNTGEPGRWWRFLMYRFVWVMPFLRACSTDYYCDPIARLVWSTWLLWDALSFSKDDHGGRLRIWLMIDTMASKYLCRLSVKLWCWRMKKAGLTPKVCFKSEPREYPVYEELSPEVWL